MKHEIIKESFIKILAGEKGREIEYSCLYISEYLLPFDKYTYYKELCGLFAIKNRMNNNPFS